MKAIISVSPDGGNTYPLGRTHNAIVSWMKTERGVKRYASNLEMCHGRTYKIEFYAGDSVYGTPYKTLTMRRSVQ